MLKQRQTELLAQEIEFVLAYLPSEADTRLVRESLTKLGRGLAIENPQNISWPLLPIITCEAICGRYERAIPVAAALQFMMGAGDVLDDVEDADNSDSLSAKYGSAIATNVATTLIMLAEKAVTKLIERGVDNNIVIHIMDSINSHYITACVGQHLDLSHNSEENISEDLYLKIISMKSASQIECACQVGALLATENQELISKFSLFGQNLGMAAQITNDIQSVITKSNGKRDIISLPIVYVLSLPDNKLSNIFKNKGTQICDSGSIGDLLFHTGAMHYAMIKIELYKQQAKDILSDIERLGVNVNHLESFLK